MANGHGGARRGAGRPFGRRNLRPLGARRDAILRDEGLVPAAFEGGDSLEFLKATMYGRLWPTREQLFAAKCVLAIEHPSQVAADGRSVEEIRAELLAEQHAQAEDYRPELDKWLDSCVRMTACELGRRLMGRERGKTMSGAPAMIVEAVDAFLREKQYDGHPISELMAPPQPRPVVRKRSPVTIDGSEYGADDAELTEAAATADARRTADPPSPPAPAVPRIGTRTTEHGNIIYAQEYD
jgi:hypothetical protein